MGFLDFILGRRSSTEDELDAEIERQEKTAYGDLYAGGAGRAPHVLDDHSEELPDKSNRVLDRKTSRMQEDLQQVERRARDLHIYDEKVRKRIGKVESSIGRVHDARNPIIRSQQNSKLRERLRKGYGKIRQENEQRLEKLRQDGASDRRLREEEIKLRKIRDDMSSMYRRSGGSGMLK